MRWLATLSGTKQDAERLADESFPGLSTAAAPGELLLELSDPEGPATNDEGAHVVKAAIDAAVRHINGFGRLRWGRAFEGVSVLGIKSLDPAGQATQHGFIETAVDHMLPEDYAAMIERTGHPRPDLPAGIEIVNALRGIDVTTLVETNPDVGRVLHLIDLMLVGDDEIDWVAGYSALEVIEQDLKSQGLSGQALGWWTESERRKFGATANNFELVGFRARHGKRIRLPKARMTTKEGSWFVRRAAANWLTRLLAA